MPLEKEVERQHDADAHDQADDERPIEKKTGDGVELSRPIFGVDDADGVSLYGQRRGELEPILTRLIVKEAFGFFRQECLGDHQRDVSGVVPGGTHLREQPWRFLGVVAFPVDTEE